MCLPYSEIWKSTEDRKQYPNQPFPSVPWTVGAWLVLALRMDQTRLHATVSSKKSQTYNRDGDHLSWG